jgi:hypothetical protein
LRLGRPPPSGCKKTAWVSALEELAANSGAPFQVSCAFSSQQPPEVMDNGVALHLYYLKSATEVMLQAIQWSREEAPK